MFFSVVIPVYNVERYLDQCIQSILNQDFNDYEIILVDDGSDDSSGGICDKYSKKYKNINVIHKKNEGLLLARRTGLRNCQGEYVIHCDSDDYFAPGSFKIIFEAIQKYHPDMVMFGYEVVDDKSNIIEKHYRVFENNRLFISDKYDICYKLATTTWLNNLVTKVVKRTLIDTNFDYSGYHNIKMGEDLLQVIPLVRNCQRFVYLAKPLYKYRFNQTGISKNIKVSYLWNYFIVSKRLEKLIKSEAENVLTDFYIRFEYDVYKYFLRFMKQGIKKKEYIRIYKKVNNYPIYIQSRKIVNKNIRNIILRIAITPGFFWIVSNIVKMFLKNKNF